MENVDFGIGWPVKETNDLFLSVLAAECNARDISFQVITPKDLATTIRKIKKWELKINFLLDMASNINDAGDPFTKFVYHLKDYGTYVFDDPDEVKSSANKSIAHYKLLRAKIPVPYTIVIRRWDPALRLSDEQKNSLGSPFVIKPALGFGRRGVKIIADKKPLKQIANARLYDPGDDFLLQEFINPIVIKGRPAWFRIYSLFGEIIPCWWRPSNGEYHPVTLRELYDYNLMPLIKITAQIAKVVKIDWFSCEIAISDKDNKFYAIDYMNDQCSLYPKSQHISGVPDEIIAKIAERMTEKAWQHKRAESAGRNKAIWFPSNDISIS